ncbi:hypothetical protein F5144DRAFT_594105 [Chaetomium tenue]|uniref:Uncharacterized protein n=1 Tax=Chaetomium tenue TaxID=1854479 RepID=A0ACB7P1Z3_9PEZI|nr:hypothetical protein F5144DRAFT_594105 [Chaetomium globosum]
MKERHEWMLYENERIIEIVGHTAAGLVLELRREPENARMVELGQKLLVVLRDLGCACSAYGRKPLAGAEKSRQCKKLRSPYRSRGGVVGCNPPWREDGDRVTATGWLKVIFCLRLFPIGEAKRNMPSCCSRCATDLPREAAALPSHTLQMDVTWTRTFVASAESR